MRSFFSHLHWDIKNMIGVMVIVWSLLSIPSFAKDAPSYHAIVVDAEGVESHIQNFRFYWEERLNETTFVPHALHHVPVKRGAATINVEFSTIKEIDIRLNGQNPELHIHLANGKTGKFPLGIEGSFRGDSDFGEVDFQPSGIRKIIFTK